MNAPRRILITRLSHLGDIVHALPVFHALREAHPDASLGWAVQPEFASLIDGMPGLDRVFRFARRDGLRAWPRLARELREWSPDWTVDAQGNLKSAAVTRFSGAPRRIGWHRDDWREPLGARVLTHRAARCPLEVPHALDRSLHLARFLSPDAEPRFDLALTPHELERGEREWRQRSPDGGAVLVHLAAQGDVRSWPKARFVELCRALAAEGRPVVVLSGPDEAQQGREVAAELEGTPNVAHWIGQRGLRELASVFAAAARSGARLVCCDSGPLHLAVACGLATVALAGPQDERRTGPYPRASVEHRIEHPIEQPIEHRVVRSTRELECAPCLSRRCTHAEGPVCMTGLDADTVQRALALEGVPSPCA